MPRKIIQIMSMPPGHVMALDSEGVIYWRAWTKRGWSRMSDQVPLPDDPITPQAAPIPPPTIPNAVSSAKGADGDGISNPSALVPPLVLPHLLTPSDPA